MPNMTYNMMCRMQVTTVIGSVCGGFLVLRTTHVYAI